MVCTGVHGPLTIIELLKPDKNKVLTITSDNGKEFAGHEGVAKKLKDDFYFAPLLHHGSEKQTKTRTD
jgi:IS30 family transposase